MQLKIKSDTLNKKTINGMIDTLVKLHEKMGFTKIGQENDGSLYTITFDDPEEIYFELPKDNQVN
jgi:hypothetical protein